MKNGPVGNEPLASEERAVSERDLENLFHEIKKITSNLAHDIRGPLNLVAGYADLLAGERPGQLNPDQKQFVERIRKGAREVSGMIDQSQDRVDALNRSFKQS